MSSDSPNKEEHVRKASSLVEKALVASGLFADEARAMVRTWQKSYFGTEGVKLLYLVPREWTDRLLPITLNPEPSSLVRTLVGRIEILSANEEARYMAALTKAAGGGVEMPISDFGRFAEPKLRRLLVMASDPGVKSYTERLLMKLSQEP